VKAYPYDVELRLVNPNTREERLVTRRVYAYTVYDAYMQAVFEVSATGSSEEIKPVRVSPPIECFVTDTLDAVAQMVERLKAKV
jgi:hypothetical protein